MLTAARKARGPDWNPSSSVLEGGVQRRMFSEAGFLALFERQWDGSSDLIRAYAPLDAYLRRYRSPPTSRSCVGSGRYEN